MFSEKFVEFLINYQKEEFKNETKKEIRLKNKLIGKKGRIAILIKRI